VQHEADHQEGAQGCLADGEGGAEHVEVHAAVAGGREEDPPLVFINPEITWLSEEAVTADEGCLSFPGWVGEVARCEQVTVQGLDERGKKVRHKVEGYMARVFQHEIDHLDGVLYTDRLTDPSTFRQIEVGQEEAVELEAATS